MRLHEIKEHKPKILWVDREWKKWLRECGVVQMYATKKDCEEHYFNEPVKIRVFID